MFITFLSAHVPLTKSYSKSGGGIVKTPYPFVWEMTSHDESFNTLPQLQAHLTAHAAKGHCALKGKLSRPLNKESRAGTTNTNDSTQLLVLDLDGVPETFEGKPVTITLLLMALGVGDVSYIIQWSASYGIENKRLRAHIFMLLDKEYSAPLLKQWLIQKNHDVPMLNAALSLTKSGNALSWPLDISACQNDKLIYIAPPVLGKGIADPMAGKQRIEYVKRKSDLLSIDKQINSTAKNRELTHKRVNELRDSLGLPTRKHKYKVVGSQEVLLQPDESVITEMKTERGFTYFNLNGGDSWAYYHPENNPDYILNFKGEPAYLTKELLPDYWREITGSNNSTRVSSDGVLYLAFLDRRTSIYWRGTYDPTTDTLDLTEAKNETQLRHFAKQYGVPIGDFVPEWDRVFDPTDFVRVDVAERRVNVFQPTPIMLAQQRNNTAPKAIPPTIKRVINHALGGDDEIFEHFINWVATVTQTRDRTRTAWVLHGTEGTGKGILVNRVLRPMFGAHLTTRRMEELSEKYNHFMENSFLVFVDEIQTRALQNEQGVMAKLRNFITEATVPIRRMHANAVETRNYTNWIFSSNMPDPVSIKRGDRRMNVAKYQPKGLQITDAELEKLAKEVPAFYNFLMAYEADYEKAGQIIETHDRNTLISISENSADTVSNALMGGDFQFFLDQLPTDDSYKRNALMKGKVDDYIALLQILAARTSDANGACNISRDELRTIYDYTVGNMSPSPNKFTSLLKHHRVHLEVVWVGTKSVRGMKVQWRDYKAFPAYIANHFPAPASVAPVVVLVPKKPGRPAKKAA